MGADTLTVVKVEDNGQTRIMTMPAFRAKYGSAAQDILDGIVAGKKATRFHLSASLAESFGRGKPN